MKAAPILAGVVFATSMAAFVLSHVYLGLDIGAVYAKVQMPFFTGFLTSSSFLLSLKTFILLRLKQDIYDQPAYAKRVRDMQVLKPSLAYYGPLSRLSETLVFSVLMTLGCSVSQITLGFIPNHYISAVCFSLAVAALAVVLLCWWYIRENLAVWFETMERDKAAQ